MSGEKTAIRVYVKIFVTGKTFHQNNFRIMRKNGLKIFFFCEIEARKFEPHRKIRISMTWFNFFLPMQKIFNSNERK
jgi:hypothetical protein